LKLNRTHELLFHADDANLRGKIINTTKKNIKASLVTNKVVGLEIHCKYVFNRMQNKLTK